MTRRPPAAGAPAALGYRMPAEWEPHAGTWLSWPHNRATWPARLERVERIFFEMVQALAPREAVHVNVQDAAHARHVRCLLADMGRAVRLHAIPTDDAWIRDYGAVFLVHERGGGASERAAVCWRFNSWGGKYPPWERDAAAAWRMAEALDVSCFRGPLVLEGGAVETNGAGLLLTTTSCLPNANRNPGASRRDVERHLRAFFGHEEIIWLEGGGLAGDDTDGHVDNLARFVGPRTVLAAVEDDPGDANYAPLRHNLSRLRSAKTPDGQPLEVLPLPMPAPVVQDGQRLPASYANFYVANGVVLLPAYGGPQDEEARRVLSACFPGRAVVPIDCRDVVWGLGALHCLTQQVPLSKK